MPISGVVITSRPAEKNEVLQCLAAFSKVEVHGDDEKGKHYGFITKQKC